MSDMRAPSALAATWTLSRLIPRLVGVKLAAGLLPGATALIFVTTPLLPVLDWAALRVAASATEPLPGAAIAVALLLLVALGARRAMRAALHGAELRFLDRLPLPPLVWGPGLAALAYEVALPVAGLSWFWESPSPWLQGLVFLGVAVPALVAAAGAGPRAAGWLIGVGALGVGALTLARAAPGSLPVLAPLVFVCGVLASGWIHADLRLRASDLELGLPGRPRTAVAAWLRWDLTLVLREEPRALLWAAATGSVLGLMTATFAENAGLEGSDVTAVGLVFFAMMGLGGCLPLVRALDLQAGRLAPACAPFDPGARVVALALLGALGLAPGAVSVALALAATHPPGLAAVGGFLVAAPVALVWLASRPDPRRAHRINLGWAGGALWLCAAVGAALPQLGPALLVILALLAARDARSRFAASWGRVTP